MLGFPSSTSAAASCPSGERGTSHARGIAYRADIDGLRALAIVAVVLFHAFPSVVPGGFVGVDVFFVISGYLIGGIVFREVDARRFSLTWFWARRACRLLPALLTMLIGVLAVGWTILLPDEWWALGQHTLGGATYVSDFILAKESGYFDSAAEMKPLQHLWSLAIEEQFYIGFPLLALACGRKRVVAFILFSALLIGSFGYGLIDLPRNPVAAYFLPHSRAWELLVGVLLARRGPIRLKARGLVSVTGLAAIATSVFLFSRDVPYPGMRASLPVLGSALVVAAGPEAWPNARILARRWPVALGLVSYPLYLWHWPLLSFARILAGGEVESWLRASLVLLAGVLAMMTYRLVEWPVRFGRLSRRPVAAFLVALCGLVALGGEAVHQEKVPAWSSRFGLDPLFAAVNQIDYFEGFTMSWIAGRKAWRVGNSDGVVLFLGDSNMQQYAPRMRELLLRSPAAYYSALFVTNGGCAPIPTVVDPDRPDCDAMFQSADAALNANRVVTVVIAGLWRDYFENPRYRVDGLPLSNPEARDSALRSLSALVRRFAARGRRVVLVLNIPSGPEFELRRAVSRGWPRFTVTRDDPSRAQMIARFSPMSEQLAAAARSAGAEVIDPIPFLCDDQRCPAISTDGTPIYRDGAHLSIPFVRTSVTYLDSILRRD